MNSPSRQKPRLPLTKEGFLRLVSGHPWLFKSQLSPDFSETLKFDAQKSALLPIGEHWFLFSPHSEISLRRFGPATRHWPDGLESSQRHPIVSPVTFSEIFGPWLKTHLAERFLFKKKLLHGENCFRWIFSESDQIPGLILDYFDGDLVAQIQSHPMEHFWPVVKESIIKAAAFLKLDHLKIHEVRRAKSRAKEGLEVAPAVPAQADRGRWIKWNGLKWWMNPAFGQKTGAYFDQKDNHWAAVHWAKELGLKKAWDLCSFEGGFGLHLANHGLEVLAVDESALALEVAHKNAQENSISNYQSEVADVFSFLRNRFDQKEQTDMIVLDPPGMAGSKKNLEGAMRGLKELNLRALHCLRPGGLLVTCTCSHAIGLQEFQRVMREAAHDSRRTVRVLERRGPSADHAPLIGFVESEYLQAWYLEVQ